MQEQRTARGNTRMIVFGGFLGAGKTTMMMRVAQMIEASGKRVGVIMNDQGDQLVVDTGFGRARGFDVAEVTGGCFCCRFDALVSTTAGLVDDLRADVVLAEAVGSCADLNATVIRPLKEYYGERFEVAPLVVMVDPSRLKDLTGEPVFEGNGVSAPEDLVPYLFRKQIEEAHVIVLNKADLLPEGEAEGLVGLLQSTFPHARTIAASAETGAGVDALLELLSMLSEGAHRKLEIDYRLYADAEAELAWLNTTLKVRGNGQQFRPAEYVDLFLSKLSAECERRGYVVGHAKVQLTTPDGWTKASLVRAGDEPVIASRQRTDADGGELLVNARVEADPTALGKGWCEFSSPPTTKSWVRSPNPCTPRASGQRPLSRRTGWPRPRPLTATLVTASMKPRISRNRFLENGERGTRRRPSERRA